MLAAVVLASVPPDQRFGQRFPVYLRSASTRPPQPHSGSRISRWWRHQGVGHRERDCHCTSRLFRGALRVAAFSGVSTPRRRTSMTDSSAGMWALASTATVCHRSPDPRAKCNRLLLPHCLLSAWRRPKRPNRSRKRIRHDPSGRAGLRPGLTIYLLKARLPAPLRPAVPFRGWTANEIHRALRAGVVGCHHDGAAPAWTGAGCRGKARDRMTIPARRALGGPGGSAMCGRAASVQHPRPNGVAGVAPALDRAGGRLHGDAGAGGTGVS